MKGKRSFFFVLERTGQSFGLEISVFIEEAVGGAKHSELRSTVEGIADFLLLLRELEDVGQRERVTFVEEGIGFGEFAVDHLRTFFAIAFGRESVGFYAVFREVFHHAFRSSLRETEIIGVIAAIVAMGGKLNGDVGIFLEHARQAVEGFTRGIGERRLVEFIEDIAHKDGHIDRRKGELQNVLSLDFEGIGLEVVAHIEIAFAGGQEKIADASFEGFFKRTVGEDTDFLVGTVAAYHVDLRLGELIAILLVDPSFDSLEDFGIGELEELVPSSSTSAARRGEVASIVQSFEGDAEIVGRRIHGGRKVSHVPGVCNGVLTGPIEIEASEAIVASVGGEIEFSVGTECGEAFVACSVDGGTEVFYESHAVFTAYFHSPDVKAAIAAWHVGGEIEPTPVGRHGGMGIGRKGVGRYLHLRGFAPFGVGTL